MTEVTQILSAIELGDPHAARQLLPLVYDELRRLAAQKLAQESAGQTLQCRGDPDLHRAVERLRAAHPKVDQFTAAGGSQVPLAGNGRRH